MSKLTLLGLALGVGIVHAQQKPWLNKVRSTTQYCVDRTYDFSSKDIPQDFWVDAGSSVSVENGSLRLTMTKSGEFGLASTLSNGPWFSRFGVFTARMRMINAPGSVVSVILMENGKSGAIDGRDEADWEFVRSGVVESNVFANYKLIYGKNGRTHVTKPEEFQDYTIDWNEDRINWKINNSTIRTLNAAQSYDNAAQEWIYPANPMRLQFGIWDSGATGSNGTAQWAGGPIKWSDYPNGIIVEINSISVRCVNQSEPSATLLRDPRKPVDDAVSPSPMSKPFEPIGSFALSNIAWNGLLSVLIVGAGFFITV